MKHPPLSQMALLLACVLCAMVMRGDDKASAPSITEAASKLQRIRPQTPEESRKAIVLHDGFQVELVAAEPLVRDPVAVDFDENGRMYVVELPPYNSYVLDDFQQQGSIRLLEDTNSDGVYDRSSVYADGLRYPTAVACWDGGVFVGAAPDLLYLKDVDGDAKADQHQVVFTGFGSDKAGEAHLNSFRWGFDNRFHISTNLSGGDVRVASNPKSKPVSVRGRGLLFDPRDLSSFELTSGGGQHGMSMDDWGRKFVCANSVPAQLLMYDDRYVARNPHLPAPQAAVDIAPEGKFTRLFRISPPEPWRQLRTKLRREGQFRGSDEGGRPFGFFTGATGITIYRGDAWPAEFRGNLIVGDVANNLVYRARLKNNGLGLTAKRADAEREFLASKDIWFRPVQFANAPDGSLYVLDMYRELIEGAAFLPPEFFQFINVVGGYDRGRVYRIVPTDHQRRATPQLGKATTGELVALIEHPNGWHRDAASRLIYQRQDLSAARGLRRLVRESSRAVGRMTALYALDGLESLDEATLLAGLGDKNSHVRCHALRLAESFAGDSTAIRTKMLSMLDDDDPRVRHQLAFSLGSFDGPERNRALVRLAVVDDADKWGRLAVQSSLANGSEEVFRTLAGDQSFRNSAGGRELLTSLATQIGSANRSYETAAVTRVLNELPAEEKSLSEALVEALVKNVSGAARARLLAAAGGMATELVRQMLADARRLVADVRQPDATRAEAVRTLGLDRFSNARPELVPLLQGGQPQSVQLAAVDTLGSFDDPEVADVVIAAWPSMSPAVRSRAAETLFSRAAWIRTFLASVKAAKVHRADVAPSRIALLQKHPDEMIRREVAAVFTAATKQDRAQVVTAYQQALRLNGDAARGRALFRKVCAACHRLEDHGNPVGADLKAISDRGDDAVLLNILDPNREVKPKFISYVVLTNDGRVTSGMILSENANSVTIRRTDATQVTIQRNSIGQLRGSGLSFMPEGLEKQFDIQGAADLLAYLRTASR